MVCHGIPDEYALHTDDYDEPSRWFALAHRDGEDPLEHQALLSKIDGVAAVVPSYIRPVEDRSARFEDPPEDLQPQQWHHHNHPAF